MADNALATWAPFLYDLQGKVVEVFPTEAPFLAELSGVGDPNSVGRFTRDMDGGRSIYSGKSIKHTIITQTLPAGGYVQETSTWNVPETLGSQEVHLNLVRALVPFSVTVDVERDSFNNSGAVAVTQLVREARIALARMENLAFVGDGTGLVSTIASGTSPGLAINVSTTGGGNLDVLLPGTVWDVLTKTTGADPGSGKRRIIASVTDSIAGTQTVTFDTAAQASDGGSGNITFTTSEGIYIPGSWSNGTAGTSTAPGALVAQGLEQAAAASGTFETLNKANVASWQGTDGRGGDTTVLPLSDQILDGAVRRGRRAGLGVWDFALGDPAAIDAYKQGKYAQVRYGNEPIKLVSGFSGVAYEGADQPFPIVKEPAMKKQSVRFIDKNSMQLYGDQAGPSFLEDDGSMFRRFGRTLAKEADLLDRVQLGFTKCNTIIKVDNLQQAS
jgi:hypothetical protein